MFPRLRFSLISSHTHAQIHVGQIAHTFSACTCYTFIYIQCPIKSTHKQIHGHTQIHMNTHIHTYTHICSYRHACCLAIRPCFSLFEVSLGNKSRSFQTWFEDKVQYFKETNVAAMSGKTLVCPIKGQNPQTINDFDICW